LLLARRASGLCRPADVDGGPGAEAAETPVAHLVLRTVFQKLADA
jgi:hypothetical protein